MTEGEVREQVDMLIQQQGWDAASLQFLFLQFLQERSLGHDFVVWLETQAAEENEESDDEEEEP